MQRHKNGTYNRYSVYLVLTSEWCLLKCICHCVRGMAPDVTVTIKGYSVFATYEVQRRKIYSLTEKVQGNVTLGLV